MRKPTMTVLYQDDRMLFDFLFIYFFLQNEKFPDRCTGLNVSQLSTVLSGMSEKYQRVCSINCLLDEAAIHYCFDDYVQLDPTKDGFPIDGYSKCTQHIEPANDSKPLVKYFYGKGGKEKYPMLEYNFLGDNGGQPDNNTVKEIFYYCVQLNLLNAKKGLPNMYDKACSDEDYFKLTELLGDDIEEYNARMADGNRINPTDPRMIASRFHSHFVVSEKTTKGNLLIDKYGASFVLSIVMSCLDEINFCEAMFTYLLGIVNQENRWMQYGMMIDILRTFDAALSKLSEINIEKSQMKRDFFEIMQYEYSDLTKGIDFLPPFDDNNCNMFIKNIHFPFFGLREQKYSPPRFIEKFLNFLWEYSRIFQESFRKGDREVLDHHWIKVFNHFNAEYILPERYEEPQERGEEVWDTIRLNMRQYLISSWKAMDTELYPDEPPIRCKEVDELRFFLDVEQVYEGKELKRSH